MSRPVRQPAAVRLDADDFHVEELLRTPLGQSGDFAVYRATKRLLTTPELQRLVASELGRPPRTIMFPALKDKRAVSVQHFSVHGRGSDALSGRGYSASFVGRLDRHLGPHDLEGNRFTITLRDLPPGQAPRTQAALEEAAVIGLPNYFDEQRFASYTPGGPFIGKAVLQRDAEGALKAYMAHPAAGDPAEMRKFKAFALEHWGDWDAVTEKAPLSNYRSILTFLRRHPGDFRKAVNLITSGLMPVLLAAYQSHLWNRVASRILSGRLPESTAALHIAGLSLHLYRSAPAHAIDSLRETTFPLPNHRMRLEDEARE
ncbi:MAG: tRNA pseudouridine(13) synthase TruD, partial [SAR202 cluster bacterium]|nr:tRNA pseudouridine(13) synthase TruD [SAR202 cluster bacterium]